MYKVFQVTLLRTVWGMYYSVLYPRVGAGLGGLGGWWLPPPVPAPQAPALSSSSLVLTIHYSPHSSV